MEQARATRKARERHMKRTSPATDRELQTHQQPDVINHLNAIRTRD
jgi:hypothetical protein